MDASHTSEALDRALLAANVCRATDPAIWPTPPDQLDPARFAATIRTHPLKACQIALLGLPDDLGVKLNNGRPGAAKAPAAIRDALTRYGAADPAGIPFPLVFDAGDVSPAPGGNVEALNATHRRVSDAAAALTRNGFFPIALGGGHDLTFAFVRGVIEATLTPEPTHPTHAAEVLQAAVSEGSSMFAGIYFDAHLDVRDTPGSGMPFRALVEQCGVGPLLAVGPSTLVNTREHARWFAHVGGVIAEDQLPTMAESAAQLLEPIDGFQHLFASLDLDVIDAAAAPGVSAMNPAGLTPTQVARMVYHVAQHPRLRCFDIMELCPPHDQQGRTARLAAHLLLTFLQGWKQGRPLA